MHWGRLFMAVVYLILYILAKTHKKLRNADHYGHTQTVANLLESDPSWYLRISYSTCLISSSPAVGMPSGAAIVQWCRSVKTGSAAPAALAASKMGKASRTAF